MSVLNEPFANPSRVRGTWRLLAHLGSPVERSELEEMLSPFSIAGDVRDEEDNEDPSEVSHRNRIRKVINEMVKMGVVVEEGGMLCLAEDAVPLDGTEWDDFLVNAITRRIFDLHNEENHDLVLLISWFYSQNAYAPMTWDQIARALDEQTDPNRLGCKNKTRFEQFEYWANYLGFTWTLTIDRQTRLVVDPTNHLSKLLPDLFVGTDTLRYSDIQSKLASLSPLLENGWARKALNKKYSIENRDPLVLSSSTAFAWYRLQEEGTIELLRKSDADMFLFPEASGIFSGFSGITWKRV
ncbi:protein DpdG [Paenibacillus tyrfis]|uniref:Uncharacterized protein n=1 Tax=Paenibacillus tyrfis TaxID=1501230 RepID=A0A081NU65_9BACL|nr:protein DpdG [Paenibacillus tyrfis]KEQ21988.1 hypothetical protein ET33_28375 [Paenibacillus tyrfis]